MVGGMEIKFFIVPVSAEHKSTTIWKYKNTTICADVEGLETQFLLFAIFKNSYGVVDIEMLSNYQGI